jgi:hypothetical protein
MAVVLWGYFKRKVLVSKPIYNHRGTKAKNKGRNRSNPEADGSSGAGKSSKKIGAVFEKWWGTSERRNLQK